VNCSDSSSDASLLVDVHLLIHTKQKKLGITTPALLIHIAQSGILNEKLVLARETAFSTTTLALMAKVLAYNSSYNIASILALMLQTYVPSSAHMFVR
jgi:hypothetical protein